MKIPTSFFDERMIVRMISQPRLFYTGTVSRLSREKENRLVLQDVVNGFNRRRLDFVVLPLSEVVFEIDHNGHLSP